MMRMDNPESRQCVEGQVKDMFGKDTLDVYYKFLIIINP